MRAEPIALPTAIGFLLTERQPGGMILTCNQFRSHINLEDQIMSTAKTAKIATVDLGLERVEGLLGDDGEFYIGVSQVGGLLQKALLGVSFQSGKGPFLKLKTDLNPEAIDAMSIEVFHQMVFNLAIKGHPAAIDLARLLIRLSLQQLFNDAFEIHSEVEERSTWLAYCHESKLPR